MSRNMLHGFAVRQSEPLKIKETQLRHERNMEEPENRLKLPVTN